MTPRPLPLLLIAAALAGAVALWWAGRPEPLAVKVVAVERGTVESTVANTRAGTVKAARRAHLAPATGGRIERLLVREGDRVERDQLLLELWNADLAAKVELAARETTATRSKAEEACLLADEARREFKRLDALHRRGLASEEQADKARTAEATRRIACRTANDQVKVAEARLAVAQATLQHTRLTAPFAGVVAEVNGEVGEFVTPSPPGIPTPPAVDLIDDTSLFVSAPMDEVDAPAIRPGLAARITLDAYPERTFTARVDRVAPYVYDWEKQARTVEVEATLDPGQETAGLLAGYSADLEVVLEVKEGVARIPSEALIDDERVLVLGADGVLEERTVTPGLGNWRFTEISGGLAEGERVVVSLGRDGVEAGARAVAETE